MYLKVETDSIDVSAIQAANAFTGLIRTRRGESRWASEAFVEVICIDCEFGAGENTSNFRVEAFGYGHAVTAAEYANHDADNRINLRVQNTIGADPAPGTVNVFDIISESDTTGWFYVIGQPVTYGADGGGTAPLPPFISITINGAGTTEYGNNAKAVLKFYFFE